MATKIDKEDFGLTAEQLNDKYNPNGDGEHPVFTRGDWRSEVFNEFTLRGYWEYVEELIREAELEELKAAYTKSPDEQGNAKFIAISQNLMPEPLKAVELVGILSRMETDGEIQDRTEGNDCMSCDDAAATLSNLIKSAREIQSQL